MKRGIPRHVLRVGLVVAFVAAVLDHFSGGAHAATPAWTPCGSAVVWASPDVTAPKTLATNIAAAYALVAPLAGLQVTQGTPPTVRWHTIDRGVGDTTTPGDSVTRSLLGKTDIRQHSNLASGFTPDSVLRDVLHDVGVASPTSVGGVLSPADAAAITAVCAAAATPTTTPAPTTTPSVTVVTPAVTDAPGTLSAPAARVPMGLVLAGVLTAVAVWLPLETARTRLSPLVTKVRTRLSPLATKVRARLSHRGTR